MSWRIVDARFSGSNPVAAPSVPCQTAGITHVRVDLVNQDTSQPFSFTFECIPGAGQTYDVTYGRYQATVTALDGAGTPKSQQTFFADNTVSFDLGLVVFVVFPPA